jgi:hypothetical protein
MPDLSVPPHGINAIIADVWQSLTPDVRMRFYADHMRQRKAAGRLSRSRQDEDPFVDDEQQPDNGSTADQRGSAPVGRQIITDDLIDPGKSWFFE